MRTNKPRDLALRVLKDLSANKTRDPGDCLETLFRKNPLIDERDRAFISRLVLGVLRWRLRLDWIIGQFSGTPLKKIDLSTLIILRLALYQIFHLDRVPESAAVNEAVNQAKSTGQARYITSFVNGLLRNICRNRGKIRFPDREKERPAFLSSFYSYPEWLVNKWIKELGNNFVEGLLSAQNDEPGLNIRANTSKATRDQVIKNLAEEGIEGEVLPYAPESILVKGFRGRVSDLKNFKKGMFQVQDQAAQMMVHLLNPAPGETVLDVCAGLGGKSTHLGELMQGKGEVISLDINRSRLVNLMENSHRLGLVNIRPVVADASIPLDNIFKYRFKKVLVDTPCSGLGVISRHPDIKWNRDAKDIERLALLQKRILNSALPVVQGGGKILYVTCTLSKQENEDVVKGFLGENKDIELVDLKRTVSSRALDLIDRKGFFRSYPHVHNMGGFFAALFRKKL